MYIHVHMHASTVISCGDQETKRETDLYKCTCYRDSKLSRVGRVDIIYNTNCGIWVRQFSEVDLYLSVVWLAVLGSPVFPHLHRATGGQTLHPEAHLLGKLHGCRKATVRIQAWHTILKLKEMEV